MKFRSQLSGEQPLGTLAIKILDKVVGRNVIISAGCMIVSVSSVNRVLNRSLELDWTRYFDCIDALYALNRPLIMSSTM